MWLINNSLARAILEQKPSNGDMAWDCLQNAARHRFSACCVCGVKDLRTDVTHACPAIKLLSHTTYS